MGVLGLNGNLEWKQNIQTGNFTRNRAIETLNDYRIVPII